MTEGATVSFLADSKDDLISWDLRLTEPGAGHPGPRHAHLGWALDITGPDRLRIELHPRGAQRGRLVRTASDASGMAGVDRGGRLYAELPALAHLSHWRPWEGRRARPIPGLSAGSS